MRIRQVARNLMRLMRARACVYIHLPHVHHARVHLAHTREFREGARKYIPIPTRARATEKLRSLSSRLSRPREQKESHSALIWAMRRMTCTAG